MPDPRQLDVLERPPRQRHALIFDTCDALGTGDALVLVNDHDPRPLYYQLEAKQPLKFGWEYLECGPESLADSDHPPGGRIRIRCG